MRIFAALTMALTLALTGANAAEAEDSRALVQLPAPMQEHMLANMRDHLATLDEILGRLAEGKFDAAAKLAEERLGMSSLERHGASHMAPFMPKPMQDMGTNMHRAASKFAIAATNASVTPSFDGMRAVFGALHEVTATCAGCHAAYRLR
jgi:cytochrome c556